MSKATESAATIRSQDYPESWDKVAEVRVFRTTPGEWSKLIAWRGEMQRKGWRLLRVSTVRGQLTGVFGRTRPELKSKAPAETRA